MIFSILLALIATFSWANPTLRWLSALEIVEKHEFYSDNEVIQKPKDTWQTLFAVLVIDASGSIKKDCLYYYVPGRIPGELKIKTIAREVSCDSMIFEEGSEKWTGIKALQYATTDKKISVSMTFPEYKTEKWDIQRLNQKIVADPSMSMSSAEFRSGAILYLSPSSEPSSVQIPSPNNNNKKLCHVIADDCQELSPSTCGDCLQGWYEVPNGCKQGPKYCGIQECGKKHQPACRRGMTWQRKIIEFDCRRNNSFAYCSKGLKIQCEGSQAFCL